MDRQKLTDTIRDALDSYRMLHLQDGEGNGSALADLLSDGHPTIKEGQEEIQRLAEHIADALHELKAIKFVDAASEAELRAALEMCLDFCQGQAGSYPHDCAVAARAAIDKIKSR